MLRTGKSRFVNIAFRLGSKPLGSDLQTRIHRMLEKKFYRIIYYSGIFIFVGNITSYFYNIISQSDEGNNPVISFIHWLLLSLIFILVGAHLKSSDRRKKTANVFYLVLGIGYVLLIGAIEYGCDINIYALCFGFIATACVLGLGYKQRGKS